jgi:hypothetical protein
MLYEHSEVRRIQAHEHADELARAYTRSERTERAQAEAKVARVRDAVARLAHRPRTRQARAPRAS